MTTLEETTGLWEAHGIVRREPFLFLGGEQASAGALFAPDKLLRVYRADGAEEYSPECLKLRGRQIVAPPGGGIPVFDAAFCYPEAPEIWCANHRDRGRFLRYRENTFFHERQICIDYTTNEIWEGPFPPSVSEKLPGLPRQLAGGAEVRVALLGDSISTGQNASGHSGAPPFQPPWGDLVIARIKQLASGPVIFRNFSKGGMTARWGVEQAEEIGRFAPHLLMVAFGMNDISEQQPLPAFFNHLLEILRRVRLTAAKAECLFVSGMAPNPEWSLAFPEMRQLAHEGMVEMASTEPGCAVAEVYPFWNAVVERKGFLSITGNGLNHPNDFGHRLYAAVINHSLGLESL